MRASALCFRAAVVFLAVGMTWGMIMGISQDHSAMPAHAHLNLLGWVSLFLMGLYYRLHPSLDGTRIALAQVCLWTICSIVHPAGMGLVLRGHMIGGPMIGLGSVQLLLSLALLGWQVFRGEAADSDRRTLALVSTPSS